jgi:hypothetical protein
VSFVPLRSSAPAAPKPVSSLFDISPNVTNRAAIKRSMRRSNTSAHLHTFDCRPTATGSVFDDSSDSDSIVAIGLSDAPKEFKFSSPPPTDVFVPPSKFLSVSHTIEFSSSQVTTRFSPASPPKAFATSSFLIPSIFPTSSSFLCAPIPYPSSIISSSHPSRVSSADVSVPPLASLFFLRTTGSSLPKVTPPSNSGYPS